ncbi:hypothetical protein CVT26_010588 [Gymnopilus dilepis]|uniref:Uncharacterized protein n=1 Tax=Gymnopilus dilepis TaxID=231916 RepID=A0A409VZD6_9AGAR|nr:hypothetical protein CVT26_010588 [Gymnopilus dilepis]
MSNDATAPTPPVVMGVPLEISLQPPTCITSVDIGGIPISIQNFTLTMMSTSLSLTDAYIYVVPDLSAATTQPQPYTLSVHMPNLKKFHLRALTTRKNLGFLRSFYLPALVDFWLEWGDRLLPYQWDLQFLVDWLILPSASLARLFLTDLPVKHPLPGSLAHNRAGRPLIPNILLENLLRIVPNLQTLCLPISLRVSIPIHVGIACGDLLPNLYWIELAVDGLQDAEAVVSMVRRRNQNASSARYLSVIMALDITLPTLSPSSQASLRRQMHELRLEWGYSLRYRSPCPTCQTYCYFAN